ncbi:MAG: hypothetical protein D3924_20580, partial [Candidatus Electrothrix sp. AR4]|nr:hypothetical protein [Candidatus Electrothrix sp. AR4]
MIREILSLCACDTGHQAMYSRLRQAMVAFQEKAVDDSWNRLLHEAERQGLAPLLYHHSRRIDIQPPKNMQRLLHSLYLRSRHANDVRCKATAKILNRYHSADIPVLLVKGIALCNLVYQDPGLRPMRDIDLLVNKSDLAAAKETLLDLGYLPEKGHDIPDDYYHLPPMVKKIQGLPVTIELHHNLLPFHPRYPLWPLEKSYDNGQHLSIDGVQTRTLSLEDTLWYVYLHGFQAPLTYESFRLMHVADIMTLIDKHLDQINWQKLQGELPTLINAISRLHYLTPFQDRVISKLRLTVKKQPAKIGVP